MSYNSAPEEPCGEVRILLDAYLDSELGSDTAAWVLRHLASCQACEAERSARAESKATLKSGVQRIEPDPGFEHVLRRRLREEARPKPFKGLVQLAMAASLLVALFAGWSWSRSPQSASQPDEHAAQQEAHIDALYTRVSTAARPGLGDHLHCAHYRKFSTTLPSFEEMVEKLGPDYQDLLLIAKRAAPEGFRVVLGHRCKHRGRAFIHLALERDAKLLSVIVAERRPEESFDLDGLAPAFHTGGVGVFEQSAEQFHIASFETSRHLAYVISDLDGSANREIASALFPELETLLRIHEG